MQCQSLFLNESLHISGSFPNKDASFKKSGVNHSSAKLKYYKIMISGTSNRVWSCYLGFGNQNNVESMLFTETREFSSYTFTFCIVKLVATNPLFLEDDVVCQLRWICFNKL